MNRLHENLDTNLYPFDVCKCCIICDPTANSKSNTPLNCDRCAMGETPDRFDSMFTSKHEKQLETALLNLCEIIGIKSSFSETELYDNILHQVLSDAKLALESNE